MRYFTTPLGRLVAEHENGTLLEDLILKVLHDFRMSPFNASNFPMTPQELAQVARVDLSLAISGADALVEKGLVERAQAQTAAALSRPREGYRITGAGVVFVLNAPQGLQGLV